MYYTPQELAEKLRVSLDTIYRDLNAKRIPAVRVGRQWRIPRDRFEDWEREQLGGESA